VSRYDLTDRTVVITGSTGGLGSALARALRDRGAHLAMLDLDPALVDAQADQLGGKDVAAGWTADVRDFASVQQALDDAADHFGSLDVVIANAGIGVMAPMSAMDPQEWEYVIDVNLHGVWRTFRAALPHVERTRGYLLAISSMAAFVHSPLNGPYVASKAGVWALCDATRLELRHLGIDVGSVHPTFFQTPMLDEVHADPAGTTLWGGNTRGIWKAVPIDTVVDATIRGIERRSPLVVPSRTNALVARIPGLVRPLVDRIGFRGTTIPDAIALATGRD